MHIERDFEVLQAVPICGVYNGEPLWRDRNNYSTYYGFKLNYYGSIPLIEEDKILENILNKYKGVINNG